MKTQTSDDPKDLEALTPSHILLLKSNSSIPFCVSQRTDCYSKRRWRQAQYLASVFWLRWVREYLPCLQKRQKWFRVKRNLQEDDIVMLIDKNVSRGQWPLARVVETFPNKHGIVCSVKVRNAKGYLMRPINNLVFLEGQTTEVD